MSACRVRRRGEGTGRGRGERPVEAPPLTCCCGPRAMAASRVHLAGGRLGRGASAGTPGKHGQSREEEGRTDSRREERQRETSHPEPPRPPRGERARGMRTRLPLSGMARRGSPLVSGMGGVSGNDGGVSGSEAHW